MLLLEALPAWLAPLTLSVGQGRWLAALALAAKRPTRSILCVATALLEGMPLLEALPARFAPQGLSAVCLVRWPVCRALLVECPLCLTLHAKTAEQALIALFLGLALAFHAQMALYLLQALPAPLPVFLAQLVNGL